MKTCLKNIKSFTIGLIVLSLGLLLSGSSAFSQSSLKGYWQLQNPDIESNSVVWGFNDDGTFNCTTISLKTFEQSFVKGFYGLSNDTLFLKINGENGGCIIRRPVPEKLIMYFGDKAYTFAKYGSSYDNFMKNYAISIGADVPVYTPTYTPTYTPPSGTYTPSGTSQSTDQLCWCCKGTGSCNVCSGKGKIATYPPTTCTSCAGTGRCTYCNGTGRFIKKW